MVKTPKTAQKDKKKPYHSSKINWFNEMGGTRGPAMASIVLRPSQSLYNCSLRQYHQPHTASATTAMISPPTTKRFQSRARHAPQATAAAATGQTSSPLTLASAARPSKSPNT